MREIRCKKCGKLLAKVYDPTPNNECNIFSDFYEYCKKHLQIKCPRCGEMNTERSVEDEL